MLRSSRHVSLSGAGSGRNLPDDTATARRGSQAGAIHIVVTVSRFARGRRSYYPHRNHPRWPVVDLPRSTGVPPSHGCPALCRGRRGPLSDGRLRAHEPDLDIDGEGLCRCRASRQLGRLVGGGYRASFGGRRPAWNGPGAAARRRSVGPALAGLHMGDRFWGNGGVSGFGQRLTITRSAGWT